MVPLEMSPLPWMPSQLSHKTFLKVSQSMGQIKAYLNIDLAIVYKNKADSEIKLIYQNVLINLIINIYEKIMNKI